MNKLSVRSGMNNLVIPPITWFLLTGLTSWADAASTLTLKPSAEFAESDRSDVLVRACRHEVETVVGSRLKLNTTGGTTLFLNSQATTYRKEIEVPLWHHR